MIFWLYRLKKKISRAVSQNREPKLLARGVALGLLLGLTPSGNLTSIAIALLIFCLRLNHALAALTAIATALVAPALDPVSHWIGLSILSDPPLFQLLQTAWNQPLLAWTDLNNTIVLGSFAIGLSLYYPVLRSSEHFFRKLSKENNAETEGESEDIDETRVMASESDSQSQLSSAYSMQTPGNSSTSRRKQIPDSEKEKIYAINGQERRTTNSENQENQQLQLLLKRLKEQTKRRAS